MAIPTEGEIIVNGKDISKKPKQAKKEIGYMPENVPLYHELTVREFVSYMAELKLVKRKDIMRDTRGLSFFMSKNKKWFASW